MPSIEWLSIKRGMCKAIDNKTTSKKFDSKTRHVADSKNYKTNKETQTKLDYVSSSTDYFKSRAMLF